MGDEPIVGITERSDHDRPADVIAVDGDQAAGDPLLDRQRASAAPCIGDGHRLADEEQAGEHVEPIARPRGAHERRQLAGGQVGEHVGAEPLGDRGERVAGVVERLAGPPHVIYPVEEPHPMIVPPGADPGVSHDARPRA